MRIKKQMTHQKSQKPSKQWKHLKTDNKPRHSGNHAVGDCVPGSNAGGCHCMLTPFLNRELLISYPKVQHRILN